ncbi:MAG: CBS domain-containing protein [Chitinophagales bacterium]|nr:CBS domain-containing protein [Chitinophagales bacterium]
MKPTVAAIMTKEVVVASPENSLIQVIEFFNRFKIQHLPVCRNQNELVGIISVNDVVKFLYDYVVEGKAINENVLKLSFTAADIMTPNPTYTSPDAPLEHAHEVLSSGKFHSLPVCKDGKLVGIVTTNDLIKVLHL